MNIYEVIVNKTNKEVLTIEASSEDEAKDIVDEQLYFEMNDEDSVFQEWEIEEINELEHDTSVY